MEDDLSFEDALIWGVSTFTFFEEELVVNIEDVLVVDFHPEQDVSRTMPNMQGRMTRKFMVAPS